MSTVVNAFLKQAERRPKAVAVLDIQGAMTYGRMNHLSAFLAERILERIGGKGRRGRIALLLPRTKYFIVAQFAVLRAGCAVVPVDAEYPRERVQTILEDVGCALCLTTAALADKAAGFPTLLQESVQPEDEDPEEDLTLDLSDPDAEGYILYTSGSTGRPKGVVHRQEMLNCPVETLSGVIPLNERSRSLNIAGFSFIAGLVDIMPLLTAGGSVYVANEEERKNTELIHTLFRKRQITGMYCPPQMYTVMRKLYGPLPLEYVLLIGEKYNGEETEPGVWESYGASEACPPVLLNPAGKGGPLCLGKPAARTEVYLVDEAGNRIDQPGEIGELCVTSPWLALGYHNMPRETAERFTDNPFEPGTRMYHSGDQMAWDENGNLIFHGRRDRMVKIRGYRVELGEIDQVMRGREGISEAACVNVRVHGGDLICCYYTGEEISPETLKRYAGTFLPEYMVPAYFVRLDAMPRNDRNKVDYPTLKALEIRTDEAKYEAPATETEKKICAAFEAALEMPKVSATADFFDCGGTSLSAAVLISRLNGDGFTLAFRDVSAHSTPRELAAFLDAKQDTQLPAMDREIYPLTRTQMGIYLESLTGGARETYTLPYMIRADRSVCAEDLVQAVVRTLDAHPGMKYIIRTDGNGIPGMVPVPEAKVEVPVFEGTEENRMKFMQDFMPVVPMMEKILIHPAVYKTPERCYLMIKTHLIFFDASAISLFIAELNRVLAGREPAGEACTIQQAALYEENLLRNGAHDRAKEYYLNLFRDAEDVPALSGDLNGPLTPGVSRNLRWEPGTLKAERVKAFCEKARISENGFFMGAMALMLGKYL
ncbi:MAG: non-ribosomal peptide synthetase, partial [Clostridia bacterium]|nr:non-ribosomal peptide synthetase [Clostridia bacterium]